MVHAIALVKCHFLAKLILGLCVLHTVFLSDVSSDVIGVTTNYSADNALSNPIAKEILPRLRLLHVPFLRQKIWDVFMMRPVHFCLHTSLFTLS